MKKSDLSYSGVVNRIQGEEDLAADMLVEIAKDKEAVEESIKGHEESLKILRSTRAQLKDAASYILQHLEKDTPLAVKRDGFIVVVTYSNISIERNVL